MRADATAKKTTPRAASRTGASSHLRALSGAGGGTPTAPGGFETPSALEEAAIEGIGGEPVRILVVDDNRANRLLVQTMLRKQGYDTIGAEDGRPAIEIAERERPDLILLDIVMPGLDGFAACQELKANPLTRDIPVIFFSALTETDTKVEAFELGAVDYISKPFHRAEVLARVRTHLKIQQLTRTLRERQNRLEEDLSAAADIQRSLLPSGPSPFENVEMVWRFLPCDSVGGDVFNVYALDDRHAALYMLDVSGHGVPAAMVTVSVARSLAPEAGHVIRRDPSSNEIEIVPPAEVLEQLDEEYPVDRFGKYFTIAYAVLDRVTGELRYSLGGHPPLLVLRANGTHEWLDAGGPLVGLGGLVPFEEGVCHLGPGDRIYLYTDGIPEMENREGTFFGEERLLGEFDRWRQLPISRGCDRMLSALSTFGDQRPPQDDITLLAIEFQAVEPVEEAS